MIEARPDIVVADKVKKETMIIDAAIPRDTRVCEKKQEKVKKQRLLKVETARLWHMKKVIVIPIVVGVLGTISIFEKYIESL